MTDMINEAARSIPVAYDADICVVGGSCTGVFAAVAAARLGARVAIIENNGFFGGVATAGLVNIWHTNLDTEFKKTIIGGLTMEVVERLKKRNAVDVRQPTGHFHFILNTEELKIELDEMITDAGVRPFLHARFTASVHTGDVLQAAVFEDKTGRRAVRAKYFVDATGDGDVIARMGRPCVKLDDLQPPTTCAVLRGLDRITEKNPGFWIGRAVFDPRYRQALKSGFLWDKEIVGSAHEMLVAGTRVHHADCSDGDQLTQAEIEGRRQVRAMCDILRENFAGGDEFSLAALPAYIGIRETRHARCLHSLTEPEVLTGHQFPDAIANGSYRVDIHHSDKGGITFRYLDGLEEYAVPGQPTVKGRWRGPQAVDPTFYQVPYRCLVPQGARNVLVAGRLVDCDRGAYGAVRVMVNCNQTGEAAGVAAYLSLNGNVSMAAVNTDELRKTMSAQGCVII
jgi:ribulose 1,5-bisphosphate synthetase/thiazole synthase